jgi:hypothetical protein
MDVEEDCPYGAYMPMWIRQLLAALRNPKRKIQSLIRSR